MHILHKSLNGVNHNQPKANMAVLLTFNWVCCRKKQNWNKVICHTLQAGMNHLQKNYMQWKIQPLSYFFILLFSITHTACWWWRLKFVRKSFFPRCECCERINCVAEKMSLVTTAVVSKSYEVFFHYFESFSRFSVIFGFLNSRYLLN